MSASTASCSAASKVFAETVVDPTSDVPPGAERLRALIERWLAYARTPLLPGGCFWAANLADFDSRPGPVRDALFGHHRHWLGLLAAELRHAADAAQIADLDTELAAFQIDAVLCAANTALRLGDEAAADKVHRTIDGYLG